jgi:hypothetical protein
VTHGTHSPFAALHKSGSYRGFICRAFAIARPASFDPDRTLEFAMTLRRSIVRRGGGHSDHALFVQTLNYLP